jgi:fructuronate reductase
MAATMIRNAQGGAGVLQLRDVAHDGYARFADAGFQVPLFARAAMRRESTRSPRWMHLGAGNLFRSFHARIAQRLLDEGHLDCGVHLVDFRDPARVARFHENDDLFVDVVMHTDGSLEPALVASVARSYHTAGVGSADWLEIAETISAPTLQLVTLAVTEKAYVVDTRRSSGPDSARSTIELLTALLLERFRRTGAPVALASTDNFSGNGEHLAASIGAVAAQWQEAGSVEPAFVEYLGDPRLVAYPNTMIDRITPLPSAVVASALHDHYRFADSLLTERPGANVVADFSNTERYHLLVMEDRFPNGRPPLEDAGVLLTDRATVDRVERMKVGATLNPLHTAMAVFGCLLGFTSIAEEIRDPDIALLVRRLAEEEALPAIEDPVIVDPLESLRDVLETRLPNPGLPDSPQRIATDTSQKLGPRFSRAIRFALDDPGADPDGLRLIPLVIAAWLRCWVGVDDLGNAFDPSPDPLSAELRERLGDIRLGEPVSAQEVLAPVLCKRDIFGLDLTTTPLATRIEADFEAMLAGPGAVRTTLHAAIGVPIPTTRSGVSA